MKHSSYIFLLISFFCFKNSIIAQTRNFKSEGESKQINLLDNKGTININNQNINLDGKLYNELMLTYKNQLEKREKTVKRIEDYSNDNSFKEELKTINIELKKTQDSIESYKASFYKLYEAFSKIEINTERLKLAKSYFDKGEIEKADDVLKSEDLAIDQSKLLAKKEQKSKELKLIEEQLSNNATEYFIKAQTTALRFDLSNRFQLTCDYYEQSFRSVRNVKALLDYAYFLKFHNQNDKAILFYKEVLEINRNFAQSNPKVYLPVIVYILNSLGVSQMDINDYANAEVSYKEALTILRTLAQKNLEIYLPEVAMVLNNLGILLKGKNDYKSAELTYTEALTIYRTLAQTNPEIYLPGVAMTLNNLGFLQHDKNDYVNAEASYTQALKIRRNLAQTNPKSYMQDLAATLTNLGILQCDKNDNVNAEVSFNEALTIYKSLAKINPETYLPDVAMILNNFGILHSVKNDYVSAEVSFSEALTICRTLVQTNPESYVQALANTLINLSALYQEVIINKEKSLSLNKEAIEVLIPFSTIGYVQNFLKKSFHIQKKWNINLKTYLIENFPNNPELLDLLGE
ncbi:tetratricopeptide repeat protein [Flavobacterium sp.]|uniref:tetratricopeptide repeat protein n=1 Tax=Flavobacterium sp. TaxID=239 RepID=UPI00375318D7